MPDAPASRLPYFGLVVEAQDPGPQAVYHGAIAAFTLGGRRHALKRRNSVTFEEGAREGTFSGRLTDGTPVRGNFRC